MFQYRISNRRLVVGLALLLSTVQTTAAMASGSASSRIVNGTAVGSATAYPFFVSVTTAAGGHICGGTLIAPTWVLTAAHCVVRQDDTVYDATYFRVVASSYRMPNRASIKVAIKAVYAHRNYSFQLRDSDIALLELASPVDNTPTINLPTATPSANALVRVVGLGQLSADEPRNPTLLQSIDVPVVAWNRCQRAYGVLTSNMMCIGNALANDTSSGIRDACLGDSGGPAFQTERGVHTQVGIVSFGHKCAAQGFPGVYTKLENYVSWIEACQAHDEACEFIPQCWDTDVDQQCRAHEDRNNDGYCNAVDCGSTASPVKRTLQTKRIRPSLACPAGGTHASVGIDKNNDQVLQDSEVTAQALFCAAFDNGTAEESTSDDSESVEVDSDKPVDLATIVKSPSEGNDDAASCANAPSSLLASVVVMVAWLLVHRRRHAPARITPRRRL